MRYSVQIEEKVKIVNYFRLRFRIWVWSIASDLVKFSNFMYLWVRFAYVNFVWTKISNELNDFRNRLRSQSIILFNLTKEDCFKNGRHFCGQNERCISQDIGMLKFVTTKSRSNPVKTKPPVIVAKRILEEGCSVPVLSDFTC